MTTSRRNKWLAAIMIATAAIAYGLTPRSFLANTRHVDLAQMIPRHFSGWSEDAQQQQMVRPDDLQDRLDRIYSQVLERTYVNAAGSRVMLSLAYSQDQREDSGRQTHRPDICYPSQGFSILSLVPGSMVTDSEARPVYRMVAERGERRERVTYWFTVGDHIAATNTQFRLRQMQYALHGQVADGMVFRVSTIDDRSVADFSTQQQFLVALARAIPAVNRHVFGLGDPI